MIPRVLDTVLMEARRKEQMSSVRADEEEDCNSTAVNAIIGKYQLYEEAHS